MPPTLSLLGSVRRRQRGLAVDPPSLAGNVVGPLKPHLGPHPLAGPAWGSFLLIPILSLTEDRAPALARLRQAAIWLTVTPLPHHDGLSPARGLRGGLGLLLRAL